MAKNNINVPFLREQRQFPQESQALTVEVDRSYTDIANAMNARTIGLFALNNQVQNGESWFFSNSRQQGFRQIYTFTAAGSIPHTLNLSQLGPLVRIFGTVQDSSGNWYPLPLVSTSNVNQQISLQITSANIVVTRGAGAITIAQGIVVLEFLAQP